MGFKDNPAVYLTAKMWEYSKGNRHNVVLFSILFLFSNAINFLEPLIVAKILNIIQEQGIHSGNLVTIMLYISIFVGITVSFWAFHGPGRVIERNNAFLVRANYKKYLLDGTLNLPPEWHADHHSGDTIDKIRKGTRALYNYSGRIFEVIETILRFTGSFIALAYFNFHSIYIVIFMVIITALIIVRYDKRLVKQYKELNRYENIISAKIFDIISNITTVIILRLERLVSNAIFRKIMAPFELYRKNSRISEMKWFFVSICSVMMVFLILATYIFFNYKAGNTVLAGTVYALYGYGHRISGLFFRFAYRYGDIVKERTAVMNAEEISKEFKKKKKVRPVKLGKRWKELRIDNLNFSYHTEEGAELHLDDVSMKIKRNQRIALIGASGSGKTTLLKVIRDLYHPKYVKLYLNGKLLKHGFKAISHRIALIPQDPEIFTTTIKENITLGVARTLSEIKRYTDMARFTKVVERLPRKLNSSIVEKGVNLSGGEKQRLALARGLMACEDKAIILLDEPTSSVDFKNELIIFKNIFKNYKKKTIIASI
ncbi:ATP-binding cassette domain-containing protein, partial [Candidatus Woesearchaeota archaeon]|nr:ATP-binding cassette domain-containing protein [Candidatus Woesearchaeota archaeon]